MRLSYFLFFFTYLIVNEDHFFLIFNSSFLLKDHVWPIRNTVNFITDVDLAFGENEMIVVSKVFL